MSTPLVSYLIPAYNAEPFIEACIESIRCIAIPKEIIIINDGSTDKTGEIIDRYAQHYPYIRSYHQANVGEGATRNRLLALAQGEWIQWVDADDEVMNGLEDIRVMFALGEQKKADVIKGLYKESQERGMVLVKQPVWDEVAQQQVVTCRGRAFLSRCIGEFNFHQNGCCFFRRVTLVRLGLQFDEQQYLGLDELFLFTLLSMDITLVEVPCIVYHWKTRNGSVSQTDYIDLKHVRSRMSLLQKMVRLADQYQLRKSPYVEYFILRIRLVLSGNYNAILRAGYPLNSDDDERLRFYSFSPEEYRIAKQHDQQIHARQAGRTYYVYRD